MMFIAGVLKPHASQQRRHGQHNPSQHNRYLTAHFAVKRRNAQAGERLSGRAYAHTRSSLTQAPATSNCRRISSHRLHLNLAALQRMFVRHIQQHAHKGEVKADSHAFLCIVEVDAS
jgi:hypothetical protein